MKWFVGLCAALLLAGCGPHPLAATQPSAEALAREVLGALTRRAQAQLRALALTEQEFEERVWPGLPAARPERNMPWSYVWLDLNQKSEQMLGRTLQQYGARRYELVAVRFDGEVTTHGTYRLHRDTVLTVRDGSGEPFELRILGTMIEADEGWKVFSYVVDE